ncbi:MAG: type II secretion system F family protein [Pseudomonadota bacterium]|nr:type II secretion system F family protein [Pseudomonadota bacterium]QKK05842.1 MAG: type II secretion system F family protein [Pseudomonadota bacterium]
MSVKFSYRALNTKGHPVRGVISAANENDLAQQLEKRGYELIDCKEVSEKKGKLSAALTRGVKTRDLIQLFVHLEQLQRAGVPLMDGLADIRDTTESAKLRDIMMDIYRDVSEGQSLSAAMAVHPREFGQIFISLIAAGEETGNLTNSFKQLVHHLKWTDEMNTKVTKATRYPKIVIVVISLVVWLMMAKVIPQITEFLLSLDQEIPPITKALIATSDFFVNYSLHTLGVMIAFYMFMKVMRSTSYGFRRATDSFALRLPMFGMLIRKISLSRFAQTFGVLFNSGLEVLKCLKSAEQTVGNLVLLEALEDVREQVQQGTPLSDAMETSGEFPSMVVRMLKIGEESGSLTTVLNQVVEFYNNDVNDAVDAMIQAIEPALTAVLGLIIVWILAAVFGPVYDTATTMGM